MIRERCKLVVWFFTSAAFAFVQLFHQVYGRSVKCLLWRAVPGAIFKYTRLVLHMAIGVESHRPIFLSTNTVSGSSSIAALVNVPRRASNACFFVKLWCRCRLIHFNIGPALSMAGSAPMRPQARLAVSSYFLRSHRQGSMRLTEH